MQAQGNVGIFGGVGRRFFKVNLVESELFRAFPRNGLKAGGLLAEVVHGEAVHIVPRGHRVQNVGFQHGVFGNAI